MTSDGTTLSAWIARRRPPVPTDFRPHVRLDDPDREAATADARVDGLVAETRSALSRASSRDASDRAGAFDLLAADAWATYAAEAALDTHDPVATLTELARRLSAATR